MLKILIAGAGPAGARLARHLASAGHAVVLADQISSPATNAFSSAALSQSEAEVLRIPRQCWSSVWSGWQVIDPRGLEYQWWATDSLGVVLDFAQFRALLWQEAERSGVELLKGCRVQLKRLRSEGADVWIHQRHGHRQERRVDLLVDATGSRRALLRQAGIPVDSSRDPLLTGHGVEWILQADPKSSARWRDRLSFLLGSRWIRHGYGWVFPMDGYRLKVGVCRLPPPSSKASDLSGLQRDLQRLLICFDLNRCPVLDRHGGVVSSTVRRLENLGGGSLIAIGDAASTANLLGGEGIRYAIKSADLLASLLQDQQGSAKSWQKLRRSYRHTLHSELGRRWGWSGRLAQRTWFGLKSERADLRMSRLIEGLSKRADAADLSSLFFDYRFERYGLRLLPYVF
ncbi:NAD(P)/FAD-dependent oxidoreductase [Synechococcus sp. MIT S1220]|uniref:NAD(P)/FAD-dependent oxidoreductase n=1 Tax=Synechococcus sp. MIT S1220 TaxID=3082549 RepID=UPI0039AF6D51